MKRFYLYGDTKENAGPCNVNRSWVENSDGSMDYARNTGRVMRRLEKIWGCITHRVVLFSGGKPKTRTLFVQVARQTHHICHARMCSLRKRGEQTRHEWQGTPIGI